MVLQMEPSQTEQASACAMPRRALRLKSMISVLPADNSAYAVPRGVASTASPLFLPAALPGLANLPGLAKGGMAAGRDAWRQAATRCPCENGGFRELNLRAPDLPRPDAQTTTYE
jgi:hypothetical protein